MHMNRRSLLIRSMFMLLISGVVLGAILSFRFSEDPRIEKILNQIGIFTERSNFQKIYLKTDKDKYMSGETIWLRAYVLNAISLKPDVSSNEVYIDLIDRNNSVRESIILKNIDGYSNGDILLHDSLPEGNYQLVAYTNWMKNSSEAFFFSKTLRIVNPDYNRHITQENLSEIKISNKQILKSEKEYVVRFFPEGGNIVAGTSCRVAFKVSNALGFSVHAAGEILDETGKKATKFESKHLGMGSFVFTPEPGRRYYAKTIFDDGQTAKFDLPLVEAKGYVIMVNPLVGDQIRLNIQSNLGNQTDEKDNEIIIVGQSRGEVRYISKGVFRGKPLNSTIPKKLFPPGIAQITIFNGRGEPVCERLVFIHPKDQEVRTKIDVETSNEGNELVYKINIKKNNGEPVAGNVSFSLSEKLNNSEKPAWSENILSNLLLTSDLTGRVENATDYFDESNPEAAFNLDYVMMVNGWRRFVWKELMAGQFRALLFAPSEGLGANEIFTTSLKPFSVNLTDKAYLSLENEEFDSKIIRKNSRQSAIGNSDGATRGSSNVNVLNQNSRNSYSDMVQYLKGRVAGVAVSDNSIIIRGVNSLNSGTDPLILQESMPITFSNLKQISPRDVESVEVLKGPDASLYGVRGANGVIIIHMRTGADDMNEMLKNNTVESTERIISFYKAREFYIPAYDAWKNSPGSLNIPRIVFWKPAVVVDSTGKATIRVKKRTDISGFNASFEGIAADGTVLHYEISN